MNLHKNILELVEYPKDGVLSKDILRSERMNVTLFCMASGTEISEYTSRRQGIVYVIEGKGAFVLEGEEIEMREGVLIRMKENAVHSLRAEKNTSFLLMLFS